MYLHTYTNLLLLQVDLDKLIVFKTKHAEHHGRLGKTIRGNGKPSECTVCPFGNGGTGFWCFLDGTLESMLKDFKIAKATIYIYIYTIVNSWFA